MESKKLKVVKPLKKRTLSKQQQIIAAFIIEKDYDKIDWPREMKIATSLVKKYNFEFFMSMKGMIGLNSLAWFISEAGKKFINDVKRYQSTSFRKDHLELEAQPVAEQVSINKKPNSLKDFLDLFNPK